MGSRGHVVILSDDDDDEDHIADHSDDESDSDQVDEVDGDAADDNDDDHEYDHDNCSDEDGHDTGSRNYAHLDRNDRADISRDHDHTRDRIGGCCDERDDSVSLDALLLQYRIQHQHHLSLMHSTHAHIASQQQQNALSDQAPPHHFRGCIIV